MTTKDGRKFVGLRHGASALVAFGLYCGDSRAQSPPAAPAPAMTPVSAALTHLRSGGEPLVLVVTSAARPESRGFFRALVDGPWARINRGLVQIVELPAEGNAATVERLRVTSTPAVLAYTRGPDGPVCRGVKAGASPEEAVAWLGSLGIGDPRAMAANLDPSVMPATHDGYPSPQQPYSAPPPVYSAPPPPPTAPPMVYGTPTPAPVPYYYSAPAPVAPPVPTSSSLVQLPGPNVVVQQGPPQIFLAPPSVGSPPPAAPNFYLPTAAPPPMAFGTPAPAPAPVAYGTPAPAPMAFGTPAPMAVGVGGPMAAVTNQTVALPTAGSRTRIRVHGPGPIRMGLANLGEKMTQLGRARIETVQETDLNTPAVQGGSGVAMLSTASAAPVSAPQISVGYIPQSPPPTYGSPPAAPPSYGSPPVTPSPQETPSKRGHFFAKKQGDQ